MAAAVLLALGIGGYGGWALRDGRVDTADTSVAALAREVSSSYAVYAADPSRPVEMGPGERAELVGWVSERLKRQISVPDLTASGYRYIGGRLVATEHGPAGLFLYDDLKGTRLAMLVRPMAIEKDTPMMRHSEGAVSGYAWADRGLGYSVVGPERPEALHPLADEMRRQLRNAL
jgi:anti-sigma factor RsiW